MCLKSISYVFSISALLVSANAQVQAAAQYPQRPLRLIVPYCTGGTPAQFVEHLKAEHANYARLVMDAGIKRAD